MASGVPMRIGKFQASGGRMNVERKVASDAGIEIGDRLASGSIFDGR